MTSNSIKVGLTNRPKRVVFVFDRVMHYHKDTIAAVERELGASGFDFYLLSSQDKPGAKGRVAYQGKVATNHEFFLLTDSKIGSFAVRYQHGLIALIEKINPDLVISTSHSGTISEWLLMGLKKRLGFRLVAWQCGYEFNPGRLKRFVLKRFVPQFDHHLAYHTNAKHYAIAHGAREDQVTVMHNTINEAAITCLPKAEARALVDVKLPSLAGKKIVLYVGAVLEEKRLEVIFDALDILRRDDVVFMLVGDGPHLPVIRQRYGERPDFISTGQIVDGVGPFFDAADVFVLPGTGGLAINEAMAHSLAVISGYADGSADDLVVDGKNGYRLRTVEPGELADRLRAVLADPETTAEMGRVGREMITGELSFNKFVGRVVSVLTAMTR